MIGYFMGKAYECESYKEYTREEGEAVFGHLLPKDKDGNIKYKGRYPRVMVRIAPGEERTEEAAQRNRKALADAAMPVVYRVMAEEAARAK